MGRTSTKEVLFYTACGKTEEAAKESLDACIRATGFNGEISRTEVIKK